MTSFAGTTDSANAAASVSSMVPSFVPPRTLVFTGSAEKGSLSASLISTACEASSLMTICSKPLLFKVLSRRPKEKRLVIVAAMATALTMPALVLGTNLAKIFLADRLFHGSNVEDTSLVASSTLVGFFNLAEKRRMLRDRSAGSVSTIAGDDAEIVLPRKDGNFSPLSFLG